MTRVAPAQTGASSAKPGTKNPAGQKPEKAKKAPRVYHPMLEPKPTEKKNKRGEPIVRPTKKLGSIPADYDIKLHRPLGRGDFEDESLYFELRAQDYDKKAAEMRKQAADVKALGSVKDRNAAKKLGQMINRLDSLLAELDSKGQDTTALRDKVKAAIEAKKANGQPAA